MSTQPVDRRGTLGRGEECASMAGASPVTVGWDKDQERSCQILNQGHSTDYSVRLREEGFGHAVQNREPHSAHTIALLRQHCPLTNGVAGLCRPPGHV